MNCHEKDCPFSFYRNPQDCIYCTYNVSFAIPEVKKEVPSYIQSLDPTINPMQTYSGLGQQSHTHQTHIQSHTGLLQDVTQQINTQQLAYYTARQQMRQHIEQQRILQEMEDTLTFSTNNDLASILQRYR